MSQTKEQKPLTITISEEVVEHVSRFAQNSGKPGSNLRVAVKGGGCSGMTYVLDIVEEPKEGDKIIEDNGLKLFVDKKSYVFLAGTVLEYSGGLNGKGFVFNNPNAKTTCGCGTSFSV
ncbi:MAG: iron-sulfur cluster assembly accessory protein [SAR202 cluster bacterium]|nr:iron-sulfur cluster assembly accessory protein [SAR202 cluster bacterium]|tara:strand:+ start:3154 stop:3507 length:354 start_codon:yes stop_codon:yes gene_type:complete